MSCSFSGRHSFVVLLETSRNILATEHVPPYSPNQGREPGPILWHLGENYVSTVVPLLSREQVDRLPERAREVVEYRKSGLSLNHVQGCPLDCAYCIRHTYGLWDQRQPSALMSDAEAVAQLVSHRYFQAHVTPLQIFNRATDPFLPAVRPHTFAVLEDLDARGLRNHVLVITRHQMKPEDSQRLNRLTNIKLTLLFTYSGIDNKQIEPYPSHVAAESMKLMSAYTPRRYRTVLYWRPLVPGLNDTDAHLDQAYELSQYADATVFTGLFYRDQIADYYKANGLPEPYEGTARRKIVPETLEQRVLAAFSDSTTLFHKTSCAVSYAHGLPDYNGHYGIRELCDICPLSQLDVCKSAHRIPTADQIQQVARVLPEASGLEVVDITERAAVVAGLAEEQPRYYLQHALAFQVHDTRHPHHDRRHGRADIGWKETPQDD
jgi:DNA repair photolyase